MSGRVVGGQPSDPRASATGSKGRADTAEAECRAGLYDQGLENSRAALVIARAAPGSDRTKVSELVGDPAWGANLDLALARVELAKGDKSGARTHLAAARNGFADHADPFQKQLLEQLSKALAGAT
ncbi:hypothetical protein IAG41_14995 [Sphingomonas sp. JC676]|uniref:hypothetical protein n=1 Tax=Sphingomonas sp. JC676 TaxID=2768065 RepID=UPI001658538A|nr:hypothetical protein [Sphingomonas sp. JC676]MBC9033700.1 hypothetical protein [Sphingomonas sp. JC676]